MQWWIIHALSAHPSTYPTYPLTHPHLGASNHSNGIILKLIERIWFCLQIYDLWKHTTHTTHRSQSLASEIMSFNHSPVVQFFWFFFWRTQVLFYGETDTPVLEFWWCLLSVSKPEWAALFVFTGGIPVTHSLRFTSGATPADHLVASIAAKPFSSTYLWASIGGAWNWDLLCHHSQCETARCSTNWAILAQL